MTDDLVKRLRNYDYRGNRPPEHAVMGEAAVEIERLRAKCRLLEADLAFHVGWRAEIERKLGDTDA